MAAAPGSNLGPAAAARRRRATLYFIFLSVMFLVAVVCVCMSVRAGRTAERGPPTTVARLCVSVSVLVCAVCVCVYVCVRERPDVTIAGEPGAACGRRRGQRRRPARCRPAPPAF